jgi:hypothetical protein
MHIASGQSAAGVHSALGNVKWSARELGPWPDLQVAGTVDVMRDRAREDAANPAFKERAISLAGDGDQMDKVTRLYNHVKHSIRFSRDEPIAQGLPDVDADDVIEVIIRPIDMANYIDQGIAIGDCDDFSMYLAALLLANDIPCAFCTVAANEQAPDQYSHVYVIAYPDGVRTACDASHGDYVGWEVPNSFGKLREWAVGGAGFWEMLIASTAGAFAAWWLWRLAFDGFKVRGQGQGQII